jgi:hypothetical protein
VSYEVWNRESANLVGDFDSESDALAFVHEMVEQHGPDVVLAWALAFEDDGGETHSIAVGADLLHWSQKRVSV